MAGQGPLDTVRDARLAQAGAVLSYRSGFGADVPVPDETRARLDAVLGGCGPLAGTSTSAAQMPAAASGWGLAVQLYSARTRRSWGIGDFTDLARICRDVHAEGGAAVLVSPLHATRPGRHQQPSPYSPASRLWLNVAHVDPDDVPGAELVDLDDLREAGQALNGLRLLYRDSVWDLKITALERIWQALDGRPGDGFDRWRDDHGEDLELFCLWSVLAETFPGPWWEWPAVYHYPSTITAHRFADAHADRVSFWAWCQWLADRQLAAACAAGADVVFDLAVGFDAGGADAWRWKDLCCFGFEVGCPPDPRNPGGQRWGLPPLHPHKLAAVDFEPYRATFRAAFRHAAGVRIDHVMGFWRLFWVPAGHGADDGAYVRYPGAQIVAVLAEEAARAGGWVVGEDMGTVEEAVRDDMARVGMLGYRVACRTAPEGWPEAVMGAVETHDQPTVAGVLDGSDVEAVHAIGVPADPVRAALMRSMLISTAGVDGTGPLTDADIDDVIVAIHDRTARSASRLVLATLEDLAKVRERPNVPNTVDERPNWRIGLPAPVEDILTGPLARRVLETFRTLRP